LNSDDFRWCVENDFQVYLVPLTPEGEGAYKIAVRRKGITTEGKDFITDSLGREVRSKEKISDITFKNQSDARDHLNYVYKYLRTKYG
jgi:hypothetical protein